MGFLHRKEEEGRKVLYLDAGSIAPNPNQPRAVFAREGLEELAESIRVHGILQPLSVRKTPTGWELVAGERRLRAARLAGLQQVPCLQVEASAAQSSLLALVENLQRRDLHYLEEAAALRRLIDNYGLTQEECAAKLGRSQSSVANKLRLLRLPEDILNTLMEEGLSERHARALLRLPEDEARRAALGVIVKRQLNVAETDKYINSLLASPKPRRRRVCLVKDVRLFLNTIDHSLAVMRSAGIPASCAREEGEDCIRLTISIPTGQKTRA